MAYLINKRLLSLSTYKGIATVKKLLGFYLSLSLRTHLILLAILLALPSVALIIHAGMEQRSDAINRGLWSARRLVSSIAREQYNLTGDAEQLLTALSQLSAIKARNEAESSAMLGNILKKCPQYGNIVIADLKGDVWASALPMTKKFNISDRRTFQNALKTGRIASGEYRVGAISAKSTIGFACPILDKNGKAAGVIALNINFLFFNKLLQQSGLPDGSAFSVIDRNGYIIYRNINPEKYIGSKLSSEQFDRMKKGSNRDTFIGIDLDGEQRIISYDSLKLPEEQESYLYIRASLPLAGVLENARWAELKNIMILSPILIVAVLLAIPIGNYCFINRIRKLQESTSLLANGDRKARAADQVSGGELGELAESIDNMAQQLAAREQLLRKNQQELDDLYNNAPCGYHSLDKNGLIVRMNMTELNWLGYSHDELVGRLKLSDLLTPVSIKLFEQIFPQFKKRGWARDVELELIRKDGTIIPALINSTTIKEEDGSFLFSRSTVYDITERNLAELQLKQLNENLTKKVEEEIDRRLSHERLLARHARLAAIGEMIGAIAHQWRQPLATLGMINQSIKMAWENESLDRTFLSSANADAQMQLNYMSDTIEGFRNFFSPEKVVEYFDVRGNIQEVYLLVAAQCNDAYVSLNIIDTAGDVQLRIGGYQNEFKQSILNLVSNSLDSIIERKLNLNGASFTGLIEMSIAANGQNIVVTVIDNGCGIPDDFGDKIFEPYFTSKSDGKGTGIGLYMTKLIVEDSMGGKLSFESGPDGTAFKVELPRTVKGVISNGY